jgi:hypothetical protein
MFYLENAVSLHKNRDITITDMFLHNQGFAARLSSSDIE